MMKPTTGCDISRVLSNSTNHNSLYIGVHYKETLLHLPSCNGHSTQSRILIIKDSDENKMKIDDKIRIDHDISAGPFHVEFNCPKRRLCGRRRQNEMCHA